MRTLSRLKALQAFEASARHGSFVGAGKELNVTAAAVGQMVRSLETWLGAPLFQRRPAGADRLAALDETRPALAKLSSGLDALDEAMRMLRNRKRDNVVTASASQAIVAKWLLPHLGDFAARFPDVVVRLDVTDRLVDLIHHEADIGIRCGGGVWPGLDAVWLQDEEIVVVCSPDVLMSEGPIDMAWLSSQTLLHDTTPAAQGVFPGWQDWALAVGADPADFDRGIRMNASTAIIQATIAGQGVALARRALVAQDVESGRLARIFDNTQLPIEWAYFAVASPEALTRSPVVAFRNWLVERWQ